MPIAPILLLIGQSAPDLIAIARARTAAEVRCAVVDATPGTTDVTVCGRRRADRYRAPLATRVADRRDDVVQERAALLHRTSPVQDLSPFLVGGGMVGVSAGVGFGASGTTTHVRPLAP
ncbi:hypothetical protein [Sphingomonas bacterium]|uniref:hypothetical protein n=1 Tax=Sphingomonas bacterium TaxID=1895847 RepID=UPI0015761A03|nr:hypothetical protein [Sphingomonas bacterium]